MHAEKTNLKFLAEMVKKVEPLKRIYLLKNKILDKSNPISNHQKNKLLTIDSIYHLFLTSDGIPHHDIPIRRENYIKFINDIETNTNKETFVNLMKNYNIANKTSEDKIKDETSEDKIKDKTSEDKIKDETSEEQMKIINGVTPIVISKPTDGKTIYLENDGTIGDGSNRYNAKIVDDDIVFEPKLFNYFGGRKSKKTIRKSRSSKRTMRKGRRRRTSRK